MSPIASYDLFQSYSHEATPEIWQETYVSALLRAILYSDDPAHWVEAYRKLDPITSREGEVRFLQAAEALFTKGISKNPSCTFPAGLYAYLRMASRIRPRDSSRHCRLKPSCCRTYEVFRRQRTISAGCKPLREAIDTRARSCVTACQELHRHEYVPIRPLETYVYHSQITRLPLLDEEVKAVQIMASAMRQTPQSYTLLHVQCDFLRSKGKLEWAVKLARQAVNCAPSEFVTWEKLTELYIDLGQYESVCPTVLPRTFTLTPTRRHFLPSTLVPCSPSMVEMRIGT